MKLFKKALVFSAIAGVVFILGWNVIDKVEKKNCLEAKKFEGIYAKYEPSQDKINFCLEKFNIDVKN